MAATGRRGAAGANRGVALDEQTREPLPAVAIHLIDVAGNRLLAVLTDAQGRFQITAPGPGRHRVRGERLGYFTGQTPELSAAALNQLVELRMPPRPVRLDSILVSGKSEERRVRVGEQLIHGRLIDEETHSTIPGATIELYSKGKRRSTTIADANGLFRIITPIPGAYVLRAQRIGYKTADSRRCICAWGLEAIEFYTAPSIPGEFSIPRLPQRGASAGNRYGPPCNVIALWTRR